MGVEGTSANNKTAENRAFFKETVFSTILVAGEKIVTPDMQPVRKEGFVQARNKPGSKDVANQWGITKIAVVEYNTVIATEKSKALSGIKKESQRIERNTKILEQTAQAAKQYRLNEAQLSYLKNMQSFIFLNILGENMDCKIADLEVEQKQLAPKAKKHEKAKQVIEKSTLKLAKHKTQLELYGDLKPLKFGKLTLDDAECITYHIFYKKYGVDKLPRQIQGPVTDHLYARGPKNGALPLKNVIFHGNIPKKSQGAGFDEATLIALDRYVSDFGIQNLENNLRSSMDASFTNVAHKNPDKAGFKKGWLNRNHDIFNMWSDKFQNYRSLEHDYEIKYYQDAQNAVAQLLDRNLMQQDALNSTLYTRMLMGVYFAPEDNAKLENKPAETSAVPQENWLDSLKNFFAPQKKSYTQLLSPAMHDRMDKQKII